MGLNLWLYGAICVAGFRSFYSKLPKKKKIIKAHKKDRVFEAGRFAISVTLRLKTRVYFLS